MVTGTRIAAAMWTAGDKACVLDEIRFKEKAFLQRWAGAGYTILSIRRSDIYVAVAQLFLLRGLIGIQVSKVSNHEGNKRSKQAKL